MSKILVIEDDTEVRENLEEILQLEGYETIGAENGIEGLELAQTHLPDLIICDVMMPGLDGYQVLAALKENPDTATIPLIFLTAKVERQDIRQGMNLGADDYITKPFIPEELRTTLKSRFKKQEAVKQKYQTIIKELENKIDYLSYYNPLTQLPNRQGLYQQFNELKPRLEGNLSVLVFSLNELRSIYSNLIQIILSNIGKKLQEYQKAEKDIVILSHVNLDQFIILYQGANIDKIGQNILDMFAEKWLINAQELWLTVSIGIAIHNQPLGGDGEREVDLDNLIAQGEVAMFHVKNNNGNGCLLYNQNIKADLNEQLFLESKIFK